jgi:hypothetical protein
MIRSVLFHGTSIRYGRTGAADAVRALQSTGAIIVVATGRGQALARLFRQIMHIDSSIHINIYRNETRRWRRSFRCRRERIWRRCRCRHCWGYSLPWNGCFDRYDYNSSLCHIVAASSGHVGTSTSDERTSMPTVQRTVYVPIAALTCGTNVPGVRLSSWRGSDRVPGPGHA